jgi:hypothetical protein
MKLHLKGTNTPTTSDERLCGAYPKAIDECRLEYLIKNMQKVSLYTWKELIQAMGPGDWKEVEKGYFALTGVAITDSELKEHSKVRKLSFCAVRLPTLIADNRGWQAGSLSCHSTTQG